MYIWAPSSLLPLFGPAGDAKNNHTDTELPEDVDRSAVFLMIVEPGVLSGICPVLCCSAFGLRNMAGTAHHQKLAA